MELLELLGASGCIVNEITVVRISSIAIVVHVVYQMCNSLNGRLTKTATFTYRQLENQFIATQMFYKNDVLITIINIYTCTSKSCN